MILNKVSYKNYRCFADGEVNFESDKPINLILGYNGTGKTEFLYSIWYVLHGFDFATLKSKESAPYSLNTHVYHKLKNDVATYHANSQVELQFTQDFKATSRKYVIKRTENYIKNSLNSTEEIVELYFYENGEKSALITDRNKINQIIEMIIPEKVLSGIMFDGERMKNLSSEDENSIKAIEGTISDVTNQKLFVALENDFDELNRKYISERRKVGKSRSTSGHEALEESQYKLRNDRIKISEEMNIVEIKIPKLESKITELSRKLSGYEETKILEANRNNYKKEVATIEKDMEILKNSLQDKEFKSTSALISANLLSKVSNLNEGNKLPKELNSKAVDNILKEEICICGRAHTVETIEHLEKLKKLLPPENMNAVVNVWSQTIKNKSSEKKDEIRLSLSKIKLQEKKINELKAEINIISSQISGLNNHALKELEKEKIDCEVELSILFRRQSDIKRNINIIDTEIIKLEKQIKDAITSHSEANRIQNKIDFITKSVKLIKEIKEIYTNRALSTINEFMQEAYKDISEEYTKGRRVYITQHVKEKYRLVAYYEDDLEALIKSVEKGAITKKYKELDFQDNAHLNEALILETAQNNSTGQSKIMTMSFIKAILDYSSHQKENDFEIVKQYPLLLDAPFSELSGENLTQSAKNLFKFNEQTILMIDPDTYKVLKPYFLEHTSTVHEFIKGEGESKSEIRRLPNDIS